MFPIILILTIGILAIAVAGIAVKMFVKKDGQFERHCENEGSEHCVCGGGECVRKRKGKY